MGCMATDETNDRDDENGDQATTQTLALSERTVRVDLLHPAELRCGITLGEGLETDATRRSGGNDEAVE